MTTVLLDFKQILNEVPFTGKLTLKPASHGVDGCTFYVRKSEEVDLLLNGQTHSPSQVELTPSVFVGSYSVRLTGDAGFPTYFCGSITVPDDGEHCLSTLVGAAEIEQRPNYRIVTSINGESGDVIIAGGGVVDPELLAQQLDPYLATEAELDTSVQALRSELDGPSLVLFFENQLI